MLLRWNDVLLMVMGWLPGVWGQSYLPFYRAIYNALHLIIRTYVQLLVSGLEEKAEPLIIFSHRLADVYKAASITLEEHVSRITKEHTVPLSAVIRERALLALLVFLRIIDSELYRVSDFVVGILVILLNGGFWLLCIYITMERRVHNETLPQRPPLSWAAEDHISQYFENVERTGMRPRWRYMANGEVVSIPSYVFN
ncbi:uncharacterized protein F4812DRAFT_260719 [Daldinia caldariorum]|uniref:uncharacterized protein n=1 Tax=Daldinia caldariorum TaxID=326644 RepID=UPI0020081121|nr:uncharacterized protein F4812DRAFT_260719 [Daldinia caldariorum]KAI1470318.1 hypothetical protein F4812DRAFT_260719 [Daldinia caldariorum]